MSLDLLYVCNRLGNRNFMWHVIRINPQEDSTDNDEEQHDGLCGELECLLLLN
jgi:hypothetical protein